MAAVKDPEEVRMSLGDHLEELRYRLILGLIGPVAIALALLAVGNQLIIFLCQPLFAAQVAAKLPPQVIITDAQTAFMVYMKIAFIGGIVLGLPWLMWQLWMFVAPGLYPSERKLVTRLAPFSAVLTFLGLSFMYYVMLPFTLWFFISFTTGWFQINENDLKPTWVQETLVQGTEKPPEGHVDQKPLNLPQRWEDPAKPNPGDAWFKLPEGEIRVFDGKDLHKVSLTKSQSMITPLFELGAYISMVMTLALANAVAFQLPLVMLILGWIGLITHEQAAAVRKYAFFGCFVIGAVLTPADPGSMFALALPLYALYELGILLIRMVGKRHSEWDDDDDDDDDDEDEDEEDDADQTLPATT
ncbi:MAG: hypothetical protein GC159_13850 [Phycisphaera sp.]|nr:hypothetical protein [Phycisphaera sp.]